MSKPIAMRKRKRLARTWTAFSALSAAVVVALALAFILISGTPVPAQAADADAATQATSSPPGNGPCDIYKHYGTPCVAAHSTTRALFAHYDGPLYQVQRNSDGKTLNIGLLAPGGFARAAAQDRFCANTSCVITRLYDQTTNHNDLTIGPAGGAAGADVGVPASALPVTAGGHQVYGMEFLGGMGYRNDATAGMATGGQPQGVYMVTSGTHTNAGCCFDYGNAETNNNDNGNGHMDAVYFGNLCWFGGVVNQQQGSCIGSGPWVEADMENGLFQSNYGFNENPLNTGITTPYVTALLKNNGQDYFALKQGNAQSGVLTTEYAGALPTPATGLTGYSPMQQEGAIILGIGGDNSNSDVGSFFEGVITTGLPADAADDAVQRNIVAVGYGGPTSRQGALAPASEVSLQATTPCCIEDAIAQSGLATSLAQLEPVSRASSTSLKQDATWIVRRGLAQPSCFSFESKDRPGDFMRHYDFVVHVEPNDGSAQFAADATFCAVAGLNGNGTSFQSYNFPDRYLRHYNYQVYVASDGGPEVFDNTYSYAYDTTFIVSKPWGP